MLISFVSIFAIIIFSVVLIVDIKDQFDLKYSDYNRNHYYNRRQIPLKGIVYFLAIAFAILIEPLFLLVLILIHWISKSLVDFVCE